MRNKQVVFIISITVTFLVIIGVFEFIHWQTETEVVDVEAKYQNPIDTTLKLDFVGDIKNRQGNNLGPDLGY